MRVAGGRNSPDRVIAFSDAVVAIAITLMLLPLASLTLPSDGSLLTLLSENGLTFGALTLSWVIIATFWLAHHRLFSGIETVDEGLLWLNFAWLFAIALMPLPTNIAIEDQSTPVTVGFYVGWMALVSLLLTLLQWRARIVPGLMAPQTLESQQARTGFIRSLLVTGTFLVVFLIALVAPSIALYFLLLQFLVDPVAARLAQR